MKLTQPKTSPRHPDKFPTTQLFILALCRLAEPIAITSILPYAWLMTSSFHVGSKNDASFYAGILIASFSFAEALSAMLWGSLSDRIGRKPVLLMGCAGTTVSLLIVGFSSNFAMALTGRIIGGLLNGNIGVIQTMVSEIVTNPDHEPRAYSIMPFVWSVGTILGPAIGGLLVKPAKTYPAIFHKDGFFAHYPWALPNIVCAFFMVVSILAGYFFLQETHPNLRTDADHTVIHDVTEHTPIIATAGAMADSAVDLRRDSYGTFNEVDIPHVEAWKLNPDGTSRPTSVSEKHAKKWFTRKVAMLTIALGIFTYHSMCYDHLLPIFFQDDRSEPVHMLVVTTTSSGSLFNIPGGLGLTTSNVGVIMSVNGIIALFIQAFIFPFAAERLGVWKIFVLVTVLHPIAYFIVPYLALLPLNLLYPGIFTCLAIRNILSILAYPTLLILLKQASISTTVLGKINGLAAAAGAACRTIAPPVAGLLYSRGLDVEFTGLAWWGAGAVALVGVGQLYFVPREKNDTVAVKSVIHELHAGPHEGGDCAFQQGRRGSSAIYDIVQITVIDDDEREYV